MIRINNSRELQVNQGRSLLATLREQQIFLLSGCGGRGACGMCRVKINSGVDTAFSASELHWLNANERNEGFRLACQVVVANDLDIEVPEKAFRIKQYRAEVASIRDLTHDVKRILLRLIDPAEMNFKAGQFIHFKVPTYDRVFGTCLPRILHCLKPGCEKRGRTSGQIFQWRRFHNLHS